MATQWYFQWNGEESGPVTFRELVERVRSGAMLEADLVRPSWIGDWQRADSVVGLFHMARRSADELSWPDEAPVTARDTASFEAPQNDSAAPVEASRRPGWMTRLWTIATFHGTRAGVTRAPGSDFIRETSLPLDAAPPAEQTALLFDRDVPMRETGDRGAGPPAIELTAATETPAGDQAPAAPSATAPGGRLWSQTVSSALAAVDARRSALRDGERPSRISRWFGRSSERLSVSGSSQSSWSGRVAAGFRSLVVDNVSALVESVLVVAIRLWSFVAARIVVSICGAAAIIAIGYASIPAHWLISTEDAFQTLNEIWSGVQAMREEDADPAEWEAFAEASHERLAKLAPVLEKTVSTSQAARELLWASRDCLPKLIEPPGDEPTAEAERQFSLHMSLAKGSLRTTTNGAGLDGRLIGIIAVVDVGIVALLLRAAKTRWFQAH